MKMYSTFPCFLALAFSASVWSHTDSKHQAPFLSFLTPPEMDIPGDPPQSDDSVLPTLFAFEASSQEQEEAQDVSYDDAEAGTRGDSMFQAREQGKNSPQLVLLSKTVLAGLWKESEGEGSPGPTGEAKEDLGKEPGGDADLQPEIPTDIDYIVNSEDYNGALESEETNEGHLMPPAEGSDFLPEQTQVGDSESQESAEAGHAETRESAYSPHHTARQIANGLELAGPWRTAMRDKESAGITEGRAGKGNGRRRVKKGLERWKETVLPEGVGEELEILDGMLHKAMKRAPLVSRNTGWPDAPYMPPEVQAAQEAASDPCHGFQCRRGKTCSVDSRGRPGCVCQDPLSCAPSMIETKHVCGTDNRTYDSTCHLFVTKCNLEGTKQGHRLHLDYVGPCKHIPACHDAELAQFPLRMRDWLKNVLLQLYERDTKNPGLLNPKQRLRARKIYEKERHLGAGEHTVKVLERDFEKNYRTYIYPVHWQFAQMDKHPTDRFLCHSELAQLRAPLVPMEHCTSRFFRECDTDKDGLLSFREWGRCFTLKDEDVDVSLLF